MSKDLIELRPATMLCDTPGCGHSESVPPRDVRKYVGATCPRCDAVMVTEATAQEVERMLGMLDLSNAVAGPVEGGAKPAGKLSLRVDTGGDIAEASFRRRI